MGILDTDHHLGLLVPHCFKNMGLGGVGGGVEMPHRLELASMIPHTITIACAGSPHVLAMELAWDVSMQCVSPPPSLKGTAQCNGLKPMHVTENNSFPTG